MVSFCWRCYSFVQLKKKLHAGPPTPKHVTSPSRVIFLFFFVVLASTVFLENAGDSRPYGGYQPIIVPTKMAPTTAITLEF